MAWSSANDRSDQTDDVLAECLEIYLESRGPQGRTFSRLPSYRVTTLTENGKPDWVIQAQVGHVDPQMMKTDSHIRRKALNNAARP